MNIFDLEFDSFCKKNNVVHIKIDNNIETENIGYLKNAGIIKSSGKYLYFLDSDMIILNDDYFEQLINFMENSNCKALIHPKMLRLKSGVDELINDNHEINYNTNNNCFCDYDNEKKDWNLIIMNTICYCII